MIVDTVFLLPNPQGSKNNNRPYFLLIIVLGILSKFDLFLTVCKGHNHHLYLVPLTIQFPTIQMPREYLFQTLALNALGLYPPPL